MTCPKCNAELTSEVKGSTLLLTCGECGWSVATSYIEPIFLDETTYRLALDAGNPASKPVLAAVSAAAGGNYLSAKKLVESAPVVLSEDLAPEVMRIARILADGSVSYSIAPDFPYEI